MTNPIVCWQDAPYLLEPLAHSFSSEDTVVKLALLSAAAKLFFQRPPECQALLGCALAAAVADTDQDVHDRGLMYYRCDTVLPAPPGFNQFTPKKKNSPCLNKLFCRL